jgi:DinB family protein
MTREDILRTLGVTPKRMEELGQGLPQHLLQRRPAAGEWSMGEIVRHLLSGERDVILPRLRRMRQEDGPVFSSSLLEKTGFASEPRPAEFGAGLEQFRAVRQETLALLRGLTEREWRQTGTTPTRGTLTIEAYAEYLANHDLEHLDQLQRSREAVAHLE